MSTMAGALSLTSGYAIKQVTSRSPFLTFISSRWRGDLSRRALAQSWELALKMKSRALTVSAVSFFIFDAGFGGNIAEFKNLESEAKQNLGSILNAEPRLKPHSWGNDPVVCGVDRELVYSILRPSNSGVALNDAHQGSVSKPVAHSTCGEESSRGTRMHIRRMENKLIGSSAALPRRD